MRSSNMVSSQARNGLRNYDSPSSLHGRPDDFTEIEAVLNEIHDGWGFMLQEEFDPVTLALALMDDSSVGKGKDYSTFQRMMNNLDNALKSIVNDYYQGFNNSIGTFGGVVQNINDSQNRVVQMKTDLKKCRQELLEKRTDLLNMWFKSQQCKEMLNILDTIESIRTAPEKLETMMQNKHVLGAANLLVESLKTVNTKEMLQIGALDDIRRTLTSQKNALYDLLIEELHNHLYLKTSYCENRWTNYTPGQQDLPEPTIKPRCFHASKNGSDVGTDRGDENMFAINENDVLAEDPEKNPETDSYYYMEIIMEAFYVLNDVPAALETIQERLPLEIHALIDRTIAAVQDRHPEQPIINVRSQRNMEDIDMYCLDKANTEAKNEILKDLLWTLYSKMEAVLRGHRFVESCAQRIRKRLIGNEGGDESKSQEPFYVYHFHEIWRPVQAEIRSLLQDYLTDQERATSAPLQQASSSLTNDDASARSAFSGAREKNKQLFRFTEADDDPLVENAYEELRTTLYGSFKRQIPGFSFPEKGQEKSSSAVHSSIIDKYASDMVYKGHKLLAKPDAYNVSVLVKPTMAFLQRLKQVFPSYDDQNAEGFGSFLDDFSVNVFLPQIEEKVMQLIHHATVGLDAFQDARNYKNYSRYPIVKSAVALISVIQSLCRTMHTMPFHTDEYIRMIEVVLLKYYEKCHQRFYSNVARGTSSNKRNDNTTNDTNIIASADWAQDESLVGLLAQNPFYNDEAKPDNQFTQALSQAEINMELKLKGDRLLQSDELIFDSKRLIALGRLYHSLKWFVREIWETRTSNNNDVSSDQDMLDKSGSILPPSTSANYFGNRDNSVLLPLSDEASKRFDALLTTYQQLAETCLFTLKLETCCHTMYYLEMAIREGNYYLEDETYEPDPYIITLNSDLMEIDDAINASLPKKDEMFNFDGLPNLIVHILVSEANHIKRMNSNGVQKMVRNILALQQNLSNFVPSIQNSVMSRAKEYYQLFNQGSEALIRNIRENSPQFTFDEYRVILGFIHDVNRETGDEAKSGKPESPDTKNDNKEKYNNANYTEWLMKLDEVMAHYET